MAEPKPTLETSRAVLFQATLAEFVAERKRLSLGLKTAGDKEGAKAIAAIAKPGASAWAVNQLHWQARADLDAMFSIAAKLRRGDLSSTGAHREAIAKLRARAAVLLESSGQAATEPLLRRVTTTLAALAAIGNYEPGLPGELTADRDPPGFEAAGAIAALPAKIPSKEHSELLAKTEPEAAAEKHAPVADLAKARREAEAKRQAEEAKRQAEEADRKEVERKRRAAERAKVSAALEVARENSKQGDRAVAAAKKALAAAEAESSKARAAEEKLAAQLKELGHPD
jgi:hypothetical protein